MNRSLLPLLLLSTLACAGEPDVASLRRAAEGGDAWAQLNLGAAYDHGIGVAPDPVQAEQWYRRAARAGVPEAQFNLGHLLVTAGRAPEGVGWIAAAAEEGLVEAQYLLGVCYAEGIGRAADRAAAERWLQRAARAGHGAAAAYLQAHFPAQGKNAPQ